ncbi:transposase [Achromatium sp. WMS2]|nr:transposase [Achromatium sp. WMS2]
MALFPPGKGGGDGVGVAYGRKSKSILIHAITDAAGMPIASCTTPANWDERAQVIPLLDAVKVRIGKVGRPKKHFKVLAADKGYDSKDSRKCLRKRGTRPQIPKRVWNDKKPPGRPSKNDTLRFQEERAFVWLQRKYRRLVVRWERIFVCFSAFLTLGIIYTWIGKLIVG